MCNNVSVIVNLIKVIVYQTISFVMEKVISRVFHIHTVHVLYVCLYHHLSRRRNKSRAGMNHQSAATAKNFKYTTLNNWPKRWFCSSVHLHMQLWYYKTKIVTESHKPITLFFLHVLTDLQGSKQHITNQQCLRPYKQNESIFTRDDSARSTQGHQEDVFVSFNRKEISFIKETDPV